MENKKKDELQNRREFFKKAAKGVLPILSAIVLTNVPSLLKASENEPMGCSNGCWYSCYDTCKNTCIGSCSSCNGRCASDCQNTCLGGCERTCSGSCEGSCYTGCYNQEWM